MSAFSSPETIVQRQLEAYNARDIETLLSLYATKAELYEHPAKLLACGAEELRSRFSQRFLEPDLHATLLKRLVMGNIVIDHEKVMRNFSDGKSAVEIVMIYEVLNGRIIRAWSIPGPRISE